MDKFKDHDYIVNKISNIGAYYHEKFSTSTGSEADFYWRKYAYNCCYLQYALGRNFVADNIYIEPEMSIEEYINADLAEWSGK